MVAGATVIVAVVIVGRYPGVVVVVVVVVVSVVVSWWIVIGSVGGTRARAFRAGNAASRALEKKKQF